MEHSLVGAPLFPRRNLFRRVHAVSAHQRGGRVYHGKILEQAAALAQAGKLKSLIHEEHFSASRLEAALCWQNPAAGAKLSSKCDGGQLNKKESIWPPQSQLPFLALAGLAMAIYLISVRSTTHPHFEKTREVSAVLQHEGIVNTPSNHSVNETVERLNQILKAKGVILFALVDHSGEAEKVGMKMLPTKLLIFGSPKAGTPIMLAAPSIALDLPLKILVWEDGQGKVWMSYNSPEYLRERHGVGQQLVQNLAVVEALAAKAGE